MMHIDLITVELFLIPFGQVCLGEANLQKPLRDAHYCLLSGMVQCYIWYYDTMFR